MGRDDDDNVKIAKGQTERRVNDAEAAVVREIYSLSAVGQGARSIAKWLNIAKVPKPRAQQGRADGWSASTVRAVLERPLYRGEVIYGRSAKAYGRELGNRKGKHPREKGQIPKPEDTWIRVDTPQLRIIDPDLAARVDARHLDRRTRYLASLQRSDGRMPEKAHGTYLLSGGMLICPTCHGHFEARKYPWKGNPGETSICSTRRRKPGVCTNTLALPIAQLDEAVLGVVEGEVLAPRFIDQLLGLLSTTTDDVEALRLERERLAEEVKRLVDSIAKGVPADSVASAIRERERDVRSLDARLRAPREAPNVERLRAALEQRATEWKADLRAEPKIARLMLRRLIDPIMLWPEPRPDFIRWEAPTRAVGLLDGIENAPSIWLASLPGTERHCGPTFVRSLTAA